MSAQIDRNNGIMDLKFTDDQLQALFQRVDALRGYL